MGMYRTPIVTGDRVALAPHTDLWMAGVRFGDVEEVYISRDGFLRYMVRIGPTDVFIAKHDDLLGAVAGTPVGGPRPDSEVGAIRSTEPGPFGEAGTPKGAMPSTEGPGYRIVGGMEPRFEAREPLSLADRDEAMDDLRDWLTGWAANGCPVDGDL